MELSFYYFCKVEEGLQAILSFDLVLCFSFVCYQDKGSTHYTALHVIICLTKSSGPEKEDSLFQLCICTVLSNRLHL